MTKEQYIETITKLQKIWPNESNKLKYKAIYVHYMETYLLYALTKENYPYDNLNYLINKVMLIIKRIVKEQEKGINVCNEKGRNQLLEKLEKLDWIKLTKEKL